MCKVLRSLVVLFWHTPWAKRVTAYSATGHLLISYFSRFIVFTRYFFLSTVAGWRFTKAYLYYSDAQTDSPEHQGEVLEVSNEFVQAAFFVEVFGFIGARRGHSAGDLLAGAAGAGERDVVLSPVFGAVDTAAWQLEREWWEINVLL